VLGNTYNAHHVNLLDSMQLANLTEQVISSCPILSQHSPAGVVRAKRQRDAGVCWPTKSPGVQTKEQADGSKDPVRPQGVRLDTAHRYGKYFSPPTGARYNSRTFSLGAIMLASQDELPPSSEHEVSHLCHEPFLHQSKTSRVGAAPR